MTDDDTTTLEEATYTELLDEIEARLEDMPDHKCAENAAYLDAYVVPRLEKLQMIAGGAVIVGERYARQFNPKL